MTRNDSRSSNPPKNKDGKIVSNFTPSSSMFERTEIDRAERENKLSQLAEENSATSLRSGTWENLLEANFFIGENHYILINIISSLLLWLIRYT